MNRERLQVYPYIPNSVPEIRRKMLEEVGATDVETFFAEIPEQLRLAAPLNLPPPFRAEQELRRHVEALLENNTSCREHLSFLGAGCYQHYVPAVCDEVNQRSEFLTAYAGEPYDDHGRFQALFEYASMMGDLLEMDVVNVPTYDGYQAAATAIRMAARVTGRSVALVNKTIHPGKLSKIRDYCEPDLLIRVVDYKRKSGRLDREHLVGMLDDKVGAIYLENPNFFGVVEQDGPWIADLAHEFGSLFIVGVDPITLGIFSPPSQYGADIACGDIQSLGMHMQCGGGQAGYIATPDEPRYVMEFPSRLFGIAPTRVPGEYGFGDVAYERTSFAKREGGKEWVGTAAALWGITAGVYLALMGPQGLVDIGHSILARTRYARRQLSKIAGLAIPFGESLHFREFIVNFDETGKTVAEINQGLLTHQIQGGLDLSDDFPELGQSSLYCVTEMHSKDDIDRLVAALREVSSS